MPPKRKGSRNRDMEPIGPHLQQFLSFTQMLDELNERNNDQIPVSVVSKAKKGAMEEVCIDVTAAQTQPSTCIAT